MLKAQRDTKARTSVKIVIAANGTVAAELTARSLDTRSPWNISWGDLIQGGGGEDRRI